MNLVAELTAENVFELQSEIARKIVEAIAVQLTPEEEKLLAQVPTQNLAAYQAYLRALQLEPDSAIAVLNGPVWEAGLGDQAFTRAYRRNQLAGAWNPHYDPNWDFMRDDPRFVELATPQNQIQ